MKQPSQIYAMHRFATEGVADFDGLPAMHGDDVV